MPARPSKTLGLISVLALAALSGGCGDDPGAPAQSAADTRGVVASASDCVSFGPDAVANCAAAIEAAVAEHEATAPAFTGIDACEEAAGDGKCERAATGLYRPRLSAFLVTLGAQTHAEPLYPAKDGAVGFQTAGKSTVLASDRSLTFSRLAVSVAETQAALAKKGENSSL